MKTASAGLIAKINAGTAELVLIYKIKLLNGTIYAHTEHDRPLTVDLGAVDGDGAVTYSRGPITQPSAFDQTTGARVDDSTLLGITTAFHAAGINRDDMLSGRFEGSEITVAWCDKNEPSLGGIIIAFHMGGEVVDKDGRFELSTRSLLDLFNGPASVKITPDCRHVFGGTACGYDLTGQVHTGEITAMVDARTFTTDIIQAAPYFAYGRLKFTTGRNAGKTYNILSEDGAGEIALNAPPYLPVAIGDEIELTRGCRKDGPACQAYNNFARYGGFPDVPGSKVRNRRGGGSD